ncbi:hypothetical protein [Helicobacter rodentium]|uniref:hypothetical protein n=1 Tax=Helicobacter rodentium TaxID=59617 RepID=UPI002638392C|nr:hypothetical protein [Helicobacter rodentium]
MKFAPYTKEYKLRMLARADERKEICFRNINFLNIVLRDKTQSKEIKQKALINLCKERDLLNFLSVF